MLQVPRDQPSVVPGDPKGCVGPVGCSRGQGPIKGSTDNGREFRRDRRQTESQGDSLGRNVIKSRGIEWHGTQFPYRGCPRRNAWVRSDPIVGRIVSNLVSNAVRYTASGGVLVGCRQRSSTLRHLSRPALRSVGGP